MTYFHMGRPKKYHTHEARLQAIRENSNRYYAKHRHVISARRKLAYQNQSSHHVGPETVPKVPPPPDPFPKFDAEVLKILQQFEDFLVGKTPSDYVKFLLRCYFKDSSRRQGEIDLFQRRHFKQMAPANARKDWIVQEMKLERLFRGWRIYGVLELMVPMDYASHTTGIS
ncbi:hypothetical protein EDD18DRAFT_1114500 [Armillaria luteobubalina]|uniref:Uncharacterized protein n=1 Tax=Armillaria luteobubalina TaxID=153913 RepID=A0AA39UGK7_9AGAR|nr:hypothetical protein EDD18DRAFT_1114500 [Armillaria luteobubalina]